jgi:hypothetical protein
VFVTSLGKVLFEMLILRVQEVVVVTSQGKILVEPCKVLVVSSAIKSSYHRGPDFPTLVHAYDSLGEQLFGYTAVINPINQPN